MPRCDAASISITSSEVPSVIATHAWQVLSGVGRRPVRAVERLREDPRERRLAGAARAGEQVRLAHLALLDRVRERPHDRFLADHLLEGLRPVLAVERGHPSIQADSEPGLRDRPEGRAGRLSASAWARLSEREAELEDRAAARGRSRP